MVSSSGSTGSERVSGIARSLPVAALLDYTPTSDRAPSLFHSLFAVSGHQI
jgi:hypothetical protein